MQTNADSEGRKYMELYQVNEFPHIAIFDPRTEDLLWSREGWAQEKALNKMDFQAVLLRQMDKREESDPSPQESCPGHPHQETFLAGSAPAVQDVTPSQNDGLSVVTDKESTDGSRTHRSMPDQKDTGEVGVDDDGDAGIYEEEEDAMMGMPPHNQHAMAFAAPATFMDSRATHYGGDEEEGNPNGTMHVLDSSDVSNEEKADSNATSSASWLTRCGGRTRSSSSGPWSDGDPDDWSPDPDCIQYQCPPGVFSIIYNDNWLTPDDLKYWKFCLAQHEDPSMGLSKPCDDDYFELIAKNCPKVRVRRKLFRSLYPHQRLGVYWLAILHENFGGGVLGDDLGMVSYSRQ